MEKDTSLRFCNVETLADVFQKLRGPLLNFPVLSWNLKEEKSIPVDVF
jgi:hypothetical protein